MAKMAKKPMKKPMKAGILSTKPIIKTKPKVTSIGGKKFKVAKGAGTDGAGDGAGGGGGGAGGGGD